MSLVFLSGHWPSWNLKTFLGHSKTLLVMLYSLRMLPESVCCSVESQDTGIREALEVTARLRPKRIFSLHWPLFQHQ